jgi:hypothetical protein
MERAQNGKLSRSQTADGDRMPYYILAATTALAIIIGIGFLAI